MEKVLEATLIVSTAVVITAVIFLYVKWIVESDRDNIFTVLAPVVFLLWLFLIFTL